MNTYNIRLLRRAISIVFLICMPITAGFAQVWISNSEFNEMDLIQLVEKSKTSLAQLYAGVFVRMEKARTQFWQNYERSSKSEETQQRLNRRLDRLESDLAKLRAAQNKYMSGYSRYLTIGPMDPIKELETRSELKRIYWDAARVASHFTSSKKSIY